MVCRQYRKVSQNLFYNYKYADRTDIRCTIQLFLQKNPTFCNENPTFLQSFTMFFNVFSCFFVPFKRFLNGIERAKKNHRSLGSRWPSINSVWRNCSSSIWYLILIIAVSGTANRVYACLHELYLLPRKPGRLCL